MVIARRRPKALPLLYLRVVSTILTLASTHSSSLGGGLRFGGIGSGSDEYGRCMGMY